MSNPFDGEEGRHITDHTGEHVHDGALDFDVWCYVHDVGFVVVGRQMLPEPMLDEIGQAGVPPVHWTVHVGDDGEILDRKTIGEVDDDLERVPWDLLTEEVQGAVWEIAGTGWVWAETEHRYDRDLGAWVAA